MRFSGNASDSGRLARADGHTRRRIGAEGVFGSDRVARNADKWTKWPLYKEKTENMGFGCAEAERERRWMGRHGNWRKAHDKHAQPADRIFPILQVCRFVWGLLSVSKEKRLAVGSYEWLKLPVFPTLSTFAIIARLIFTVVISAADISAFLAASEGIVAFTAIRFNSRT